MSESDVYSVKTGLEIAVIGLAARFSGAQNTNEFWNNISNSVETIRFFTDAEYLAHGNDPERLRDPRHVKAESVIEGKDLFDASFFGFSAKEAQMMDPQHRLFLESSYTALENAGYNPETYQSPVGVYAGTGISKYLLFNIYPHLAQAEQMELFRAMLSNSSSALPTRVSYAFNLKGPSLCVQTACSTSLVAIHLACQDLLNYRCDMALAGGVSLNSVQKQGHYYLDEGPLSIDGHCRAFDAEASGTISGDGVGIVVLKRLADALADGDHIRAVIKGSAVNNDGSTKAGFMAPSVQGQAEVIMTALALADVSAETISYVETHGTATPVGDPIEIRALTQAFRTCTSKKCFCAIGSVKTNIGHTDAAAGVAGFIKTVLALEAKQLPPSLHFEQPNSHIDFANSPFYVNTTLTSWPTTSAPRRAGVSSFGLGGTNAHIILEEAPSIQISDTGRTQHLLVLSARTSKALDKATKHLADHLKQTTHFNFADIAYTLQIGRKHFNYRRAVICSDHQDAIRVLETPQREQVSSIIGELNIRPVAFIFPGGGTQYVSMGLELYQIEPVFREQVDICAEFLKSHLNLDIREVLYPNEAKAEEASQRLREPAIFLPATFAIEYALAQLWMSLGIRPQIMLGHSLGEYTAACLAEVMSLPDALALVVLRGQLYSRISGGVTVAVSLPEQEIQAFLGESLSLASINGPFSCVVSGPRDAVSRLESKLAGKDVSFHRLHADGAAHSSLLDPFLAEFLAAVKQVPLRPPTLPFVSNLTGTWITIEEATDPSYWTKHLRHTVRFAKGIELLFKVPNVILLEVGPGQTLSRLVQKQPDKPLECLALSSMRHPHDRQADSAVWLNALGQLWQAGIPVNWQNVYARECRTRVPLPSYPFESQRYWIEPLVRREIATIHESRASISEQIIAPNFYTTSWKRSLLSSTRSPQQKDSSEQSYLIFIDKYGIGALLAKKLIGANKRVIIVTAGSTFEKNATDQYTVNPCQRADYIALYERLEKSGELPDTFLHLWNLTPAFPTSYKSLEEVSGEAFDSLLFLVQSFALENFTRSFQLWVCSNSVYEIVGKDMASPFKSLLWSFCEAISQQCKNVTCHMLDLDLFEEEAQQVEQFAEHISAEISTPQWDNLVAYRNSYRWVPTLESVSMYEEAQSCVLLRSDGCYLVTDGLGNSGYKLAACLAQLAQVKLALVDRVGLPPRGEWEMYLHSQPEQGKERFQLPYDPLQITLDGQLAYIQQLEEQVELEQGGGVIPFELTKDLNHLSALYVCKYLQDNGVCMEKERKYKKQDIKDILRIIPKFEKFLETFVALLETEGMLVTKDESIEFIQNADELEHIATLKARITEEFPDFKGYVSVLDYSVQHYSQALSGEIETANILFPDGTYSLLQSVAESGMKYSYTNIYPRVIAHVVSSILQMAQGKKKVRILEVGGGQGYLSWLVAPKLRGLENVEYYFTDIAKSFVVRAQKKALHEKFDFMQFGVLDISIDPAKQGYEKYSFDIVLEYDVIHATRDIVGAINNIQKLLVPNGIFLSIQAPTVRWASILIWGLAEGWWNFTDDELRKDNLTAVLSHDTWQEMLSKQHFKDVCIYPQSQEKRLSADRMLIVAQQAADITTEDYREWREQYANKEWQKQQNKIRKIQALEACGASVLLITADLGDSAQFQMAISSIQEKLGPVRGIIHTTSDENLPKALTIKSMHSGEFTKSFLVPMREANVLENIFHNTLLDFALWVSTSDQAKRGESAVPFARPWIDAWAIKSRECRSLPWMSIHWDDTYDGVFPDPTLHLQAQTDLLAQIFTLKDEASHLRIVSVPQSGSGTQLTEQSAPSASGQILHAALSQVTHPDFLHQRPNIRQVYVAPQNEAEQILIQVWEHLLGIANIGIEDNFFELGGESLLATQFISKLRDIFKVDVSIRAFFENPTISGVSAVIKVAKETNVERQDMEIVPLPRLAKRTKRSI